MCFSTNYLPWPLDVIVPSRSSLSLCAAPRSCSYAPLISNRKLLVLGTLQRIQLAHVQRLVEQVLPPQLLVVDRGVGGLARRRTVPLGAGGVARPGAGGGGYTAAIACLLSCHFALFEHLLLVVLVHDAHLLVRV